MIEPAIHNFYPEEGMKRVNSKAMLKTSVLLLFTEPAEAWILEIAFFGHKYKTLI
jgi:hypothetical protein